MPISGGPGGRLLPPPGAGRRLLLLSAVNSAGNGIYFTLGVLYFTRILGFSVLSVAIGLALAGACGIAAGVPIGHLSDRRGGREVMALMFAAAALYGGFLLLVREYWLFVLAACAFSFATSGANTVRTAMLGAVATGVDRTVLRARVRAATNVGVGLGSAIAVVALHADSPAAYRILLLVDVASYIVCMLIAFGLPRTRIEVDAEFAGMLDAVRDRPYFAVTLVAAVLALNYEIVAIAMPLWVVDHTAAPRYMVSVLTIVNTAVVVLTQVSVSKRVHSLRSAATAGVVSGGALFACCVVFGASAGVSALAGSVVLVVAILLQVTGEIAQSAASFVLSYDLAPDRAMGQYQGLFEGGQTLAALLGAPVMAVLPLGLGVPGWWALGGLLLVAGLLVVPLTTWARRTRSTAVERALGPDPA